MKHKVSHWLCLKKPSRWFCIWGTISKSNRKWSDAYFKPSLALQNGLLMESQSAAPAAANPIQETQFIYFGVCFQSMSDPRGLTHTKPVCEITRLCGGLWNEGNEQAGNKGSYQAPGVDTYYREENSEDASPSFQEWFYCQQDWNDLLEVHTVVTFCVMMWNHLRR